MSRTYYLDFVCVDEDKCVKPIFPDTHNVVDELGDIRKILSDKNLTNQDSTSSLMRIGDINDWAHFDEFGFNKGNMDGYGITYHCTSPTPTRIREVTDVIFKYVKLKNCVCLIKHIFIEDYDNSSDPKLCNLIGKIPINNANLVSDSRLIIKSSFGYSNPLEIKTITI